MKNSDGFVYKDELLALCRAGDLYLDLNDFGFRAKEDRDTLLVAIPNESAVRHLMMSTNQIFCAEPVEVRIHKNDSEPKAWLGLSEIGYPDDFEQPAIRLGLEDIRKAVGDKDLRIPIRRVEFSDEEKERIDLGFAQEEDAAFTDIVFTGESTDPDWQNKAVKVATLKKIDNEHMAISFEEGLTFREGFEYELQVRFHEYVNGVYWSEPCDGFIDFKIKVVPEYVTWTGAVGRNWNNDGNRTCSSFASLYKAGNDPNGTHEESFAPMAFTKVTIAGKEGNPVLLDTKWTKGDTDIKISNLEDENSAATDDIEFDLMVTGLTAGRFYANTCDEIYFKPDATLMSQQYLTYDTARVEFEMKEGRWYLLSSPLENVVAGDMYSPGNNGGRQETDAFAPIFFDPDGDNKNDRFAPAYYQRKWDNTAVLYFRNKGQALDPDYHDSYLEAEWSTEYNDARVAYSTGTGFSVHVENLLEGGNGASLARLPKADRESVYDLSGHACVL